MQLFRPMWEEAVNEQFYIDYPHLRPDPEAERRKVQERLANVPPVILQAAYDKVRGQSLNRTGQQWYGNRTVAPTVNQQSGQTLVALDENEMKTLHERTVRHNLYGDNPKAFRKGELLTSTNNEESQKSHPQAVETLENPEKSGIIQERIDAFVKDLATGKINTKISPQKQARHLYGSNEYRRYAEKLSRLGDKPSYILEGLSLDDLAELVKGKLGTGIIEIRSGNSIQEFFDCDDYVGYWYDKGQEKFIATKRVQVKYALSGGNIHIIPVKERT